MEKRLLGKTDLNVSTIGFGSAPVGFLKVEQDRITDTLNVLREHGVNLIDTAAAYPGSEEAIGRAIHQRRSDFILVTKCGVPGTGSDHPSWTAEEISRSIEQSLERLNTDCLDVVLLHSCHLDVLKRGEALGALGDARESGKTRFVGFSGDNASAMYAAQLPEVSVLEVSINICDQANVGTVLPLAAQNDVGVIAKRPLANAAWKQLDEQQGMYQDYARCYTDRLAHMNVSPGQLGFQGDQKQVWPEIALRFTLSHPWVHSAIVGTTNLHNARRNIEAAAKGPLAPSALERLSSAFNEAQATSGELWTGQT